MFYVGCQAVLVAMMVAAKVVYSMKVLYIVLGLFAVLYRYKLKHIMLVRKSTVLLGHSSHVFLYLFIDIHSSSLFHYFHSIAAFMTREFFIAIDPITTVHMGICNSNDTLARAASLVRALRDRHEDFMHGEENLKEHAATHYMDPEARRFVEHTATVSKKGEMNGTRRQSRVVHTTLGQHRVSVSVPTHTRTSEDASVVNDEVQNFEESEVAQRTGEAVRLSIHSVTLESIFIGDNRLLLTRSGSAMSPAECENVYNILVKQGCRNTIHLVRLLQWSGEKGNKLPLSSLQVCISLGIPAFHAIDVIDFISSLQ